MPLLRLRAPGYVSPLTYLFACGRRKPSKCAASYVSQFWPSGDGLTAYLGVRPRVRGPRWPTFIMENGLLTFEFTDSRFGGGARPASETRVEVIRSQL